MSVLDLAQVFGDPAWRGNVERDDRRDPNPKRRYRALLVALVATRGGCVRFPARLLEEMPLPGLALYAGREGDDVVLELIESDQETR